MKNSNVVVYYTLIVILFAVLFKYGVQISFGRDTGYIGPIFLFHAALVLSALRGQSKQ